MLPAQGLALNFAPAFRTDEGPPLRVSRETNRPIYSGVNLCETSRRAELDCVQPTGNRVHTVAKQCSSGDEAPRPAHPHPQLWARFPRAKSMLVAAAAPNAIQKSGAAHDDRHGRHKGWGAAGPRPERGMLLIEPRARRCRRDRRIRLTNASCWGGWRPSLPNQDQWRSAARDGGGGGWRRRVRPSWRRPRVAQSDDGDKSWR